MTIYSIPPRKDLLVNRKNIQKNKKILEKVKKRPQDAGAEGSVPVRDPLRPGGISRAVEEGNLEYSSLRIRRCHAPRNLRPTAGQRQGYCPCTEKNAAAYLRKRF